MLDTISKIDVATEFGRYALDVMEEYSHLGLDDEYAGTLREILVRRIFRKTNSPLAGAWQEGCYHPK